MEASMLMCVTFTRETVFLTQTCLVMPHCTLIYHQGYTETAAIYS